MSIYKIWKPTICNRPLEFTEALCHAFRNIFNFKGRARRSEYWWTAVGMYLITIVVYIVAAIIAISAAGFSVFSDKPALPFGGVIAAYVVIFIWAIIEIILMFGLIFRRLHDTGHSGWLIGISYILMALCVLFMVVAGSMGLVLGIICAIAAFILGIYIFFLTIFDSDVEENKYGISQKYTLEEDEKEDEPEDETEDEKKPETAAIDAPEEEANDNPAVEKIVEETEKTLDDSTE
jgi:uncharacterized membrane protein YhaH (DUF805 family)